MNEEKKDISEKVGSIITIDSIEYGIDELGRRYADIFTKSGGEFRTWSLGLISQLQSIEIYEHWTVYVDRITTLEPIISGKESTEEVLRISRRC